MFFISSHARAFALKEISVVRLLLFSLLLLAGIAPARAEIKLSVSYSESADLFSLMDNVSNWLDGFVYPDYREEWEKRFGWSKADQAWVDRYKEYRLRVFVDDSPGFDPSKSPDGLFAGSTSNSAAGDPFAAYFLSQPDIKTALARFDRVAKPSDVRMLTGFYRHFETKWRLLLKESSPLAAKAAKLNEQLNTKDVGSFIDRVSQFYNVSIDGRFEIFFTRYPAGSGSTAEVVAGETVLLHTPISGTSSDIEWDTIVMHELVHYISAKQTSEQKQMLTARFLSRCPLPQGARRLWMIEEPLAVAWGQAAYSTKILGRQLDPNDNWYAVPWVNIISRALAASVISEYDGDTTIDDTKIIEEAADRCRDLVSIASSLNVAIPE